MSVRIRSRSDGTTYTQVRYRINGRQSSLSFDDHAEALALDKLITKVGPLKALEVARITIAADHPITLGQWLRHHNDHLTGVEEGTLERYRSYAEHDFTTLEDIPLAALTDEDIVGWVQSLRNRNGALPSGKTVANKHGYLAGALNAAVVRGHLKANPCDGIKLPSWEREEMVFLERDEYVILRDAITEPWRPLVDFLVASGARWGEATALRPADVNPKSGVVSITKAWKRVKGGYKLGPPKTRKSVRKINVPTEVLAVLDYEGEWLFTNSGRGRRNAGGVVRAHNFHPNVWEPALVRARANGLTKTPRIHDLRHTCASWLIEAGRPLPAVQDQMGHESILTTVAIYRHQSRTSGQANAQAIAGFLGFGDERGYIERLV